MTPDIIDMARELGLEHIREDVLEAFAKLVKEKERAEFAVHAVDIARRAIAEEREACLKACERNHFSIFAAKEIRARGEA